MNYGDKMKMPDKPLAVEDLSLRIAGSDSPFALIGLESRLGPEDWAWQFLRLNHSYQTEYAKASEQNNPDDESPAGSYFVTDKHEHRKVRFAEELCRDQFGLSTWLDPNCDRLPRLEKTESWFFPQMQVIDSPERMGSIVPMDGVFSYYYESGPSHWDKWRAPALGPEFSGQTSSKVWFAVDCSVPPAAQTMTIELLSEAHRNHFIERGLKRTSTVNLDLRLVTLETSARFHVNEFTSIMGDDPPDPKLIWRAILIDTCGPIKEQVERYLSALNEIYHAIWKAKLIPPPFRERFHAELPGSKKKTGGHFSDGNFLKALVVCAQLSQRGLSAEQMEFFLRQHSNPIESERTKSTTDNAHKIWVAGFEQRLATYTEQAKSLVRGQYRWLVHTQNP
jgi:hypothetical protein